MAMVDRTYLADVSAAAEATEKWDARHEPLRSFRL
jgi:hypothetical protein